MFTPKTLVTVNGEPLATHPEAMLRWSMAVRTLTQPYRVTLPMILLVSLVPFYLFIADMTRGRPQHAPELALDRLVPLRPGWALVYGSLYLFLILLPVFVVRQQEQIRRTVLAYLMVWITAYFCFLLYPTRAPSRTETQRFIIDRYDRLFVVVSHLQVAVRSGLVRPAISLRPRTLVPLRSLTARQREPLLRFFPSEAHSRPPWCRRTTEPLASRADVLVSSSFRSDAPDSGPKGVRHVGHRLVRYQDVRHRAVLCGSRRVCLPPAFCSLSIAKKDPA